MIKQIFEDGEKLKDKLYAYGFLFSNLEIDDTVYPFFGKWQKEEIKEYKLLVASQQKYYVYPNGEVDLVLIGHAYNPFTEECNEKVILEELAKKYSENKSEFFDKINELTGIFTLIAVTDGKIEVIGDATCMQTTYYGVVGGNVFVSTHAMLIGELTGLEKSEYVERLRKYKFFHMFGNSLPGDLSPYDEIKRLVPNHLARINKDFSIETERFFSIKKQNVTSEEIVERCSKILKSSMRAISNKWQRPAISLTGGCDSKTTLSVTKEIYDKFSYFSYVSVDKERYDATAAGEICKNLGLNHKIYEISNDDADFEDLPKVKEILMKNGGGILYNNANDIRKRCYFSEVDDFDVEVKSWASEIGRAYYSKRFNGRKKFGKKITPRKCTTLYKIFFHNRKLVRQTDKVFKEYIQKYFTQDLGGIPWQEHFFWEFRVASWNSVVITGEHRYSYDITIPYNNRKLLCLLLSATIDERINDKIYEEIRNMNDPRIEKMGISVTNVEHTKKRAIFENLYYAIHSRLPF